MFRTTKSGHSIRNIKFSSILITLISITPYSVLIPNKMDLFLSI